MTRIGFMDSNKEGPCYYCKEKIQIGEKCAMDNAAKRRCCVPCAKTIIREEGATSGDQGKGGSVDLNPLIAAVNQQTEAINRLAESNAKILSTLNLLTQFERHLENIFGVLNAIRNEKTLASPPPNLFAKKPTQELDTIFEEDSKS